MKIPHTIPKLILRAYAHKQTPEELAAQYEGRILRSEDATWDEGLFEIGFVKPLSKQSLQLIIDDYPFYVQLVNEWNGIGEIHHEKAREQWVIDREIYLEKKESYDEKINELNLMIERFGEHAGQLEDMLNADSGSSDQSDDETDEFKRLKNLAEPTYVPDEFSDYAPIPPVLDQLTPEDRIYVIEELDIDKIPLELAIETIPDEYYWERICNERWPDADTYHHGGSWRRMFMEKNVTEAIEAFHPAESEWPKLDEQLELCGQSVITLTLGNLIPECWGVPRKPAVQPLFAGDEPPPPDLDAAELKFTPEDEGFQDSEFVTQFREKEAERKEKLALAKQKYQDEGREDEVTEEGLLAEEEALEDASKKPRTNSHLDLSLVLPKLTKLTKLCIVYEMTEIAENWEPRFFEFTMQDCEWLAKALVETPTINHLELNRSKMNGEQTKVLVRYGLLKMPHLKVLNLNYNNMGASGALAIARLITDKTSRVRSTLHTLKMARNNIRSKGAKAIAYALTLNSYLTFLDLRLNHIGNSGGRDMGHALVVNKSLQSLNLAANNFGESACLILAKMIQHNTVLKELDLSSNNLGVPGGEIIARALHANKTILKLDVRLANTSLQFEYDIESHLKKNRNRSSYFLVDREDIYPPDTEEPEPIEDDEEEEEGDDEDEYEVVTKWKAGGVDEDDDSDQDDDMAGIVNKKFTKILATSGEGDAEAEEEEGEAEAEEEE